MNITVGAGQAPSVFSNNTQHGIYVTGAGVVNIIGVPVTAPTPNGQGTVVANGNYFAGLRIFEAPGAAAMSTVNGLVAWGNTQTGLRLYGGAKVKVRNSVFLMNVLNGVYLTSFDSTAAGNDLSRIDLGTSAELGRNYLQASVGANPNLAGLCVSMSNGMGALTLATRGNLFAGPTDCGRRPRRWSAPRSAAATSTWASSRPLAPPSPSTSRTASNLGTLRGSRSAPAMGAVQQSWTSRRGVPTLGRRAGGDPGADLGDDLGGELLARRHGRLVAAFDLGDEEASLGSPGMMTAPSPRRASARRTRRAGGRRAVAAAP